MCGGPRRIFGERFFVIAHSVGFDVGFVDDVEAVFVTKFVKSWVVWIVGGSHGVDVELLHELEVFAHGSFGNIVTCVGVVIVSVDSFYEDGFSIDEELAVFDFRGFESDLL